MNMDLGQNLLLERMNFLIGICEEYFYTTYYFKRICGDPTFFVKVGNHSTFVDLWGWTSETALRTFLDNHAKKI